MTSNAFDLATFVPSSVNVRGIAKAWVNFNGQSTVSIRDSDNLSSMTDNGVGTYTANISSSMANANYSTGGGASRSATELLGGIQFYNSSGTATTSSFDINTYSYGASNHDFPYVSAQSFGDLV